MSQAFHVGADDGEEYWIKTLQGVDPQYRPSVAAEQVIARVGALLGIAVVQPYLVAVPTGMTLPPLRDGTRVQPGVAHATRAHASCTEDKNIPQRLTEDDNRRRHVGVWALVDLARGADLQYLYDASAANAIISHDHGLYACGTGGLDVAIMVATVSTPGQAPPDASGLDQAEVDLMATRLEGLADDSIGDILNLVPTAWPVTNEQLGTLGWFLSQRAPEVAVRLRALAPKGGS